MDSNAAAELFSLVQYGFLAAVIGLPALGLTVRLGLKPLVDAVIRLRDTAPTPSAREIEALQREIAEIRGELRRLRGAQAFDAELLGPAHPPRGREASSLT